MSGLVQCDELANCGPSSPHSSRATVLDHFTDVAALVAWVREPNRVTFAARLHP